MSKLAECAGALEAMRSQTFTMDTAGFSPISDQFVPVCPAQFGMFESRSRMLGIHPKISGISAAWHGLVHTV